MAISAEISTMLYTKILEIFAFYCTLDIVKEWVLVMSSLIEILPQEIRNTKVSELVASYTKPNQQLTFWILGAHAVGELSKSYD